MADFTQANSPMKLTTPLGADALLITGLTVSEGLSQLFQIQVDALAKNSQDVAFDKLLGKPCTVEVALGQGKSRHFHGICTRVGQGSRDQTFTTYRLDLSPQAALLEHKWQSRIFQHTSVPDILKKVLQGIDTAFEIQGTFHPRDFCVQYRESDFNFASRLMEEEGIYYFFKHTAGGHKMVLANTPQSHSDVPIQNKAIYDEILGGNRDDMRVTSWGKLQELRSGKFTLFDHSFELPHKHLEAEKTVNDSVQVGTVSHKLKVGGNDQLEMFDFPGEYAQRFDGIDKGGGEQPAELQKIFEDNKRTVEIRMQQDAVNSLVIHGASTCRQFTSGHKFTLERHFNADGAYVLTGVTHAARQSNFLSGEDGSFEYSNNFVCIPAAQPFRPQRTSLKPVIQGTQTAVVVGPPGEEIFTDKYGRVKVQFHWDREGKNDANSSCWVRVGSIWAGKNWGAIHIPRVGQEVVVSFQEGDPDQPIIVGSVYNAEMMPPYKLPDKKTQSGIKTRSTLKGGTDNFNELRFEDKKGSEDIYFHAERTFHRVVETDDDLKVGNDQTITIHNNRTEKVEEGDESIEIDKGDRSLLLNMGSDSILLKMGDQSTKLELGKQATEAMQSIEFVVGQSSIKIDQMGITIKGLMINVESEIMTNVKSKLMQTVGADAILTVKGGIMMLG
jgi:type VI secretion system secreted protein VgrG